MQNILLLSFYFSCTKNKSVLIIKYLFFMAEQHVIIYAISGGVMGAIVIGVVIGITIYKIKKRSK